MHLPHLIIFFAAGSFQEIWVLKNKKVIKKKKALLWIFPICVQTDEKELVHWNIQKMMEKAFTLRYHSEEVEVGTQGRNLVVVLLL